MTGQTCIYGGVSTKQKMDRGIHANTGFMHAPYGKDWCVPSRRESRYVFSKPLSSRCCRAEGSDFIPGHFLIASRRRHVSACSAGWSWCWTSQPSQSIPTASQFKMADLIISNLNWKKAPTTGGFHKRRQTTVHIRFLTTHMKSRIDITFLYSQQQITAVFIISNRYTPFIAP